jgi:hypothetical protein
MLMRLVPVIEQILIKSQSIPLSQKNSNSGLNPSRLGTQTATDQSTLTLLDGNKTFLLEKIDFQYQAKNNGVIMMFSADGEVKSRAQLTSENFSQVMNAMVGAVPHASWGIASNILAI